MRRGNSLRKLSQIRRFFGSMTLPAFAASAGAIAAVLVFGAVTILEQTYRVVVGGHDWNDMASPPEVVMFGFC
jgi:hypothetical protein